MNGTAAARAAGALAVTLSVALSAAVAPVAAQEASGKPAAEVQVIRVGYIQWTEPRITLSLLDLPAEDDGVAGARMAIQDNNTTGRFTKQEYVLETKGADTVEGARKAYDELVAAGITMVVADVPAEALLALADASDAPDRLIFNVSAKEDALREEECRANVVHIQPTYSMLADGLAQYLVWKRWPRWFVLTGSLPQDKLWLEALRRSAERFGAEIVEEREYVATDTARRVDSGHTQVQKQIPVFTQNAPDHDVVVVADESEIFGKYIPYRTWDPRPVAGSSGLVPTNWAPTHEQWGAYQMQNRFFALNRRLMSARDSNAWTAVRIIGEGATREKTNDPARIRDYVLGPKLEIAAFKGQKLTLRSWNHQLRQPILLNDGKTIASVSPQEGFLHENSELDTLGIDEPETRCSF